MRRLLVTLLFGALLVSPARADDEKPPAMADAPPAAPPAPLPAPASDSKPKPDGRAPRLVVICVVDQMRADYLERFGARLASYKGDGFRRLAKEGAVFTDCRHRQSGTFTGPGHATIGSGSYPSDRKSVV